MAFAVGQGLAASALWNTQVQEYHSPFTTNSETISPGGVPPGEPQKMHPPVGAGFHALKTPRQEETTSKPFLPAGVFMPDICQQPVQYIPFFKISNISAGVTMKSRIG